MILFYAQSGNNEVVVTAPYYSFPALASTPRLFAVQPVRYTTLEGKTSEFKNTDIEKFVYLPQNNGHIIIKVQFSKTFAGRKGSLITLRANFGITDGSVSRFQNFTLPYVESSIIDNTKASTEPLTISATSSGATIPSTSFNVYVNSSLEENITLTSSRVTIDTNDYKKANTGVLEAVGVTIDQAATGLNSKELQTLVKGERSKFLQSRSFTDPAQGVNSAANFFYIYAEECDKNPTGTIVEGCPDEFGDSTITIGSNLGLNNNSCNYAARAPGNVTIEHTAGGKTTGATVKFTEKNLPSNIDATGDYTVKSVSTKVNGSTVNAAPTTESINLDGENNVYVAEYTGLDSDIEFVKPLQGSSYGLIRSTSVDDGVSTSRSFNTGVFKTAAAGCTDTTALNYDSSASRDDGSCVFCDDVIGQTSRTYSFDANAASAAIAEDDDDQTNFSLLSTIADPGSSLVSYLETQAKTVWTCKIYKAGDVSLNGYGEQATTGSAVLTLANLGSSTLPIFQKVETGSSGLNSGRRFVAEVILTLGSCVHYFYKSFGVPFDGCSDPSASNYVPNPLNTGNGNCDFDTSNRSTCDGSVQFEVGEGFMQGQLFQTNLAITGTFDENGVLLSDSTTYNVSQTIYISGELDSETNTSYNFEGNPITIPFGLPSSVEVVLSITDETTGCTVETTISNPLDEAVLGCTDPTAENYNPFATENDGSCLFCSDIELTATVVNPTGTCSTSNNNGKIGFTLTGAPGAFTIYYQGPIPGSGYIALDENAVTTGDILGPGIYDAYALVVLSPDYTCQINLLDPPLYLTVSTAGCGCTNEEAINYDSTATTDDGSCVIPGCTDSLAVNYNPAATFDNSSCVYSATPDEPLCIPDKLESDESYEQFLKGLSRCVVEEGTTLLLKTKSGIKCDTIEQVKLSLITYLLNRIGLECMYNCNYIFPHGDVAVSCSDRWKAGGPSGAEIEWSDDKPLVLGDIFSYVTPSGVTQYWEVQTSNYTTGTTPPTPLHKVSLCSDVTLPSGTESYLNTFINFARKFCTVCLVEPKTQQQQMQAIAQTLDDIQLENDDNIEL